MQISSDFFGNEFLIVSGCNLGYFEKFFLMLTLIKSVSERKNDIFILFGITVNTKDEDISIFRPVK